MTYGVERRRIKEHDTALAAGAERVSYRAPVLRSAVVAAEAHSGH
jgi:hypothetical protein